MSTYDSAVPITNTALLKGSSSQARGAGRPSKLPLKPNKTTYSNASVSPEEEAMQGVEHMSSSCGPGVPDNSERPSPSSAHSGAVGGAGCKGSSASGGGSNADETGQKNPGTEDGEDVSYLSRDLQTVVIILQKSFGEKIERR